jgi:hypothetical protein
MPYDLDEQQTSIDNMADSLLERLQYHADDNNRGNLDAIYQEWIVDGNDPEDGKYEFIFLPNFTLEV